MCIHSWIDTGLIKTWCKFCNADAHWEAGKIVVDSLPRMSLESYGLPISYTEMRAGLGIWLEATLLGAKVESVFYLKEVSIWNKKLQQYSTQNGLNIIPGEAEVTVGISSAEPGKIMVSVNTKSEIVNGIFTVTENTGGLLWNLMVDNCAAEY